MKWFRSARAKNIPVIGVLLQEKAREVGESLGLETFKASNGWLEKLINFQSNVKQKCKNFFYKKFVLHDSGPLLITDKTFGPVTVRFSEVPLYYKIALYRKYPKLKFSKLLPCNDNACPRLEPMSAGFETGRSTDLAT
ncbi:hypothetical protein AVEN_87784-1 [Araneus ventricosus]|uniref:HTH CENPB-type domain-containing protein n=1 Tax=Araneus ventricosus TaxID=182803 RepID=A0A4Y2QWL3_ARAVE|nr:hypothetical protein AVEN_157243-1 [Araneus ventricosus]GBN67499.1 hypothetical protein AVEN_87784-1 [Araneus ventricosus]